MVTAVFALLSWSAGVRNSVLSRGRAELAWRGLRMRELAWKQPRWRGAIRHKSGAVGLCEKVWPWVFFAEMLLEGPWVEPVKMGCFEDSVPGLTLSFIILRVLRWFQHWFSCLSFSMLDFHYCSDNTNYKYLWLLISWWKYEDCVTRCSVPSEDIQYQLRLASNNSQMNTLERSINCK